MTKLTQRLERALKTTSIRGLRLNQRFRRTFSKRADCLFITAMPKSASTFVVASLAEATGYLRFFLGQDHLDEQDLYLPKLIDSWSMNIVCHQHTRATKPNLERMAEFSIRPVVLTRDIFDCLVSLRDHLENESAATPTFIAPDGLLARDKSDQLDALADLAAPWYLSFYALWKEAEARGEAEVHWLAYDDVMADANSALKGVLDFYGLEGATDAVDAAVASVREAGGTRRNQGTPGRGREQLSTEQIERITGLSRHWPHIDFAPIGIAPSR